MMPARRYRRRVLACAVRNILVIVFLFACGCLAALIVNSHP